MVLVGLKLFNVHGDGGELQLLDQFTNRRKQKHVKDAARKISLKYKNRGLKHAVVLQ